MLLFRIHFFLTPRSGFSSSLLLSIQVFLPVIVFTFSFLTNAVEKLSHKQIKYQFCWRRMKKDYFDMIKT